MKPTDWFQYKTKDGSVATEWVSSVKDQKSAAAYAKSQGGGEAKYIGKTGTVVSNTNGFQKWELKDQSYKEVPFTVASSETQAKPTTTTENSAAGEPAQPSADISKSLNDVNNGLAAADAAPSTVAMGVELIKKTSTSPVADDILKVGKIASKTSTGLGIASMGVTVVDGLTSKEGWKKHHTADLVVGAAQTFLLGSGLVGWGVALLWTVADIATQAATGKSITENLFDD